MIDEDLIVLKNGLLLVDDASKLFSLMQSDELKPLGDILSKMTDNIINEVNDMMGAVHKD